MNSEIKIVNIENNLKLKFVTDFYVRFLFFKFLKSIKFNFKKTNFHSNFKSFLRSPNLNVRIALISNTNACVALDL